MESMCLCLQRQGRRKELTAGKNRGLCLYREPVKVPPSPFPGRKGVFKKGEREGKRIWGIRGPDWVSNTYSGEQSVLTLFSSHIGEAVKESDNFAAQ